MDFANIPETGLIDTNESVSQRLLQRIEGETNRESTFIREGVDPSLLGDKAVDLVGAQGDDLSFFSVPE